MFSTAAMAAAAAVVLALGTQDARLLRLGLVAALWAALFSAFAAAQTRREARSHADHADQMRTTYRLELEREVSARREHALRVEHQLREQAERLAQREIVGLHAELAAMRANLELLGGPAATRALPPPPDSLPTQPRNGTDRRSMTTPHFARRGHSVPERHSSHSASTRSVIQSIPPTPYSFPPAGQQCTVEDLLAAHGTPVRRRSQRS
jgi:hypothetical protein